jgi:hypothetical protein
MKKLLSALTLLISLTISAQTFTNHYDKFIKKDRINNDESEITETNLDVIFSGNEKGDIIMYFDSTNVQRFYKTSKIFSGTSKDNFKYRYIETINEKGEKVVMQLFDSGVFRVHTQDATFEYGRNN